MWASLENVAIEAVYPLMMYCPDRSGVYSQCSCSVGCMYTATCWQCMCSVQKCWHTAGTLHRLQCTYSVHCMALQVHCRYTPLRSGWLLRIIAPHDERIRSLELYNFMVAGFWLRFMRWPIHDIFIHIKFTHQKTSKMVIFCNFMVGGISLGLTYQAEGGKFLKLNVTYGPWQYLPTY